jgi:hypothetical protein
MPALGLGLGLAFANPRSLDADALAYVNAVKAAGGTVTGAQTTAINTFVKAGKTAGWWASLKRMYLPIWAVAAPNAIDMVTKGSGTFVGGVTHASGYVSGNGTTGYFNTGFNPSSGGLTNANAWIGNLWYDLSGNHHTGVYAASGTSLLIFSLASGTLRSEICGSTRRYDEALGSLAACNGIFSANRIGGTLRHRLLRSSGLTVDVDVSSTAEGTIPNGNFYFMARNRIDTASVDQFGIHRNGAYWLGDAPSGDLDESFIASLKTLWETCTGLTLP